ncbi:MAG: type II toxin-antitoxin system Phd/YefM family antitoxin [bacterium]|nr:type II toxin-antitoxin system Phd/YefM family antitoxin [bacterium]MDT8365519.1 type II toxin-antitoxin system Phd/YefM family antitoxin [bacterium]
MKEEKNRKGGKPYVHEAIDTSVAREGLSDTLNRVSYGKERIIIKRHGKEIAALVPVEDLKFLEELEDRMDLEEARAALAEAEKEGTIPWEKVKKDLGL